MASVGNMTRVSHKNGAAQLQQHSVRPRAASRRSVTPTSRNVRPLHVDNDSESERVRVAVRLRPRNVEEQSDIDYADCVEIQPELKRLKLRKNNWSSESYRFDEIFTECASQKRVYEAVAKPVVESVLDGYNGTVMAYGQTGTGKTYTLGHLGKRDVSERGIMVRAMEDILAGTSASDCVEVSYLQLYMESIQDLLAPEKTNIPIVEDVKTGEVQVPGAEVVRIQNLNHFFQLLQIGEVNRHAANTKMNTESSRSHAILMVYIRRSSHMKEEVDINHIKDIPIHMPTIRKSKLLLVDLAGSERLDKSGSEGHLLEEAKFINLSLSSLGKCINALAENSPHIPTRDSKLTRLLRDSFGGSARTSLIVAIGPSSRHHAETASTVLFGQRAMKVVNMVKVKEEFDYEGFCRKLEVQVDQLSTELDRQQKLRENDNIEMQKLLQEYKMSSAEAERCFAHKLELLQKENGELQANMKDLQQELESYRRKNKLLLDEIARLEMCLNNSKQQQLENSTSQKMLAETTQMYEEKISDLMKQMQDDSERSKNAEEEMEGMKKQIIEIQGLLQQTQAENLGYLKALADTTEMYEERIEALSQQLVDEHSHSEEIEEMNYTKKLLKEYQNSVEISAKKEINGLQTRLQEMHNVHVTTTNELQLLSIEYKNLESEKTKLENELYTTRQTLQVEESRRKEAEKKLCNLTKVVPENEDAFEEKAPYLHENKTKMSPSLHYEQNLQRSRETILTQRNTIAKICEEVGLQKILSLLESGDLDVQVHAVKVVANLAAEDINQERIVQEGGLDALLMLVESSHNTTILRVASGAIANLAMNETNQGLITKKGGAKLLAKAGSKTDDPQTLRMVAGAIANLCGNEKLHIVLKEDGAVKALLQMASSGNGDVVAQVARGFANFAKCESRKILQGHWGSRSLLMGDGALPWLIANLNASSSSTRRHIELAICHLAQNGENAQDFTTSGGVEELRLISDKSAREDIRNLAKKTLAMNTLFQRELWAQS